MDLGLTSLDRDRRLNGLGGSDANIIMSGDDEKVYRLWQEKRGEIEPEDLSGILPVVMGQWTEELNRYWFKLQTGYPVTRAGEHRISDRHGFLMLTLDGIAQTPNGDAVFEAKHVNPFNYSIDKVAEKYMPQLQHGMMVTGHDRAVLSVFAGNLKWEWKEVDADDFYQAALLERETAFWEAVQSGELPVKFDTVEAPQQGRVLRTVDMTGSNEWGSLAQGWRDTKDAAKANEQAAKGLKDMIGDDVGLAHGHGVQIKRDARGALRISVEKETEHAA
jgi:predicted phage-related endonuclease